MVTPPREKGDLPPIRKKEEKRLFFFRGRENFKSRIHLAGE